MADELQDALTEYGEKFTSVNIRAVGVQVALMSSISLVTILAFSFFRPRERKVYAPKVKYRAQDEEDDPPPPISNGFFSWLKPLLSQGDKDLVHTIGVDAVAFLEFLSLLRWFFLSVSLLVCSVLIPINVVYTLKDGTTSAKANKLNLLTLAGLSGNVLFVHVGMSYVITFICLFWVWFYWQKMLSLRRAFYLSKKFQRSIQSRSLMITNIKKEHQSDEGLRALMMRLQAGNEKIASSIQNASIGRDLKDYPGLIEDYNDTIKDFEAVLVKYLKGGKEAKKRPRIRRGGFLGMGGTKVDAIEYYGTKLGRLRDVLDAKKEDIELLKPRSKKPHLVHQPYSNNAAKAEKQKVDRARKMKIPSENYGFVSMMDAAQAHAIVKAHKGKNKELDGASLMLAPAPIDIIWDNANIKPAERTNSKIFGAFLLTAVCFLNTVPLVIVAALSNLVSLSVYVSFLRQWQAAGSFGNWTFSLVAGILPPIVSAVFQLLLPYFIRKITKYQGLVSRSQVDRTVFTRYWGFLVISQFFVFSLLVVFVQLGVDIASEVSDGKSALEILRGLADLPRTIQKTYVQQNVYWLTVMPMRGFLAFFELAQLVKLALISIKTFLFAKTPRDIQDWTRPAYFQYPVVYANMLFLVAVGLIYAPLAPLVTAFSTVVFWISHYIYKYQLLYVYGSRVESGGRMWNVAINRLLFCLIFMQLLVVLTITLMRTSWKDAIAASPPLLVTLAFKIFVLRPYATQFKYFVPSPDELADLARESQRSYKQRFVHPALGDETLFTIMVHGEQQELVRMILAPYSRKLQSEVAGVREKDLAEYNPDLDQTLHLQQIEPGTKDDELASHVGGDGDSVLHAPVYPALERTISDQSGHGGGGGYYDRDNESEVDLVHSAAPMAGGESGWFSRQQQQHYQQPDAYNQPWDNQQSYVPTQSTANLAAAPLLASSGDAYQMADLPPRAGTASPGLPRSPGGGYANVPRHDRDGSGGSGGGVGGPNFYQGQSRF